MSARYGTPRPASVPALPPPPDELARGLCRSHREPGLWASRFPSERDRAYAVCWSCPVSAACLEWSLSLPSCGGHLIYAATTITERLALRRERRAAS